MRVETYASLLGSAVGLVLFGASAASAQPPPRPAMSCTAMAGKSIAGLVISEAEQVPAAPANTVQVGFTPADKNAVPFPAYCRIQGVIGARTGQDGKPYGLTVAIALPDDWNGRFLMQGGGGLNGNLAAPIGAVAAGDRPALARGFAVVSTDGGHRSPAAFDASFLTDQQATLDFAFNAVPTVAGAAKQVVAQYYGRPVRRAYFTGCSTGGREGMEAAERYPFLFDGIVTGAPAMRTGMSNLGLKWAAVAFNRIAPKDPATGKPIPGGAFSPADRQLIVDELLKACDGLDGVKDGMIFNVRACRFDPAALACKGPKASGCLSPEQVDALSTAFAGPTSPSGRRIYAGHAYDTGVAASAPGSIPGFLLNSTAGPVAGGDLPVAMDVVAEEAKANASPDQQLIDTYNWTNLSTFYGHGGKQLFFHGVSDPWFSALDTLDYYERLAHDNGGADKLAQSSRLFLVPGMGHCGGGPATLDRFDLLSSLVDWVEQGKAPEQVSATGADFPGRSRPLCAWPLHAHYKGQGDSQNAANFECRP
jgi:feruloyl esterase